MVALLSFEAYEGLRAAHRAGERQVITDDIDHFWQAYDKVKTTSDPQKRLAFIDELYVQRGTPGLQAFMKARGYSAQGWVDSINRYPKFWASIRPNTLSVKSKAPEISNAIVRFKKLYPALTDSTVYFTIGGLRSGGTVSGDTILIGTEIAAGTAQVDTSEFPDKWLASVFSHQSLGNTVTLTIHEYVHTQQHGGDQGQTVLAQCIKEGSCDFIAERVAGRPLHTSYLGYGAAHDLELRRRFKETMFSEAYGMWLYNGSTTSIQADLGYYIGYAISRAYYLRSADKKKAIKDIVELDYASDDAVEGFLRRSGFYPESWDKKSLVAAFATKQPRVIGTSPISTGDTAVDASTKEITIRFDKAMNESGFSLGFGPRGKDYYPVHRVVGFSSDRRSFTVEVGLLPNHEYEFVVTPLSFSSTDGYPLRQSYTVSFRTS